MSEQAHNTEESWLLDLDSPDPALRLAAVEQLVASGSAAAPLVRALERIVLVDPDSQVRGAALRALSEPRLQAAQRDMAQVSLTGRQFMLREIDSLEKDGLVTSQQAGLIRGRYALPGARQPAAQQAAGEKSSGPSLS